MSEPREHPRIDVQHARCPYCHDEVAPAQPKAACGSCMAWHHRECWDAHGTCSACGGALGSETPAQRVEAKPPQQGRVAPAPAERRCVRLPCDRLALPGHPVCERHVRQDANVALGVGLGNVLFWAVMFAWIAGGDARGDLGGLSLLFGALGVMLAGWGVKGHLDLRWLRRLGRTEEPPR